MSLRLFLVAVGDDIKSHHTTFRAAERSALHEPRAQIIEAVIETAEPQKTAVELAREIDAEMARRRLRS